MLKNNKGITLMSLIVYIITMVVIMAILTNLNFSFTNSYKDLKKQGENLSLFNKINVAILGDVKTSNNSIVSPITDNFENQTSITFNDGTSYNYNSELKAIYRNDVRICSNVYLCSFSKTTSLVNNTKKEILSVHLVIGEDLIYNKTIDYVLKYY